MKFYVTLLLLVATTLFFTADQAQGQYYRSGAYYLPPLYYSTPSYYSYYRSPTYQYYYPNQRYAYPRSRGFATGYYPRSYSGYARSYSGFAGSSRYYRPYYGYGGYRWR